MRAICRIGRDVYPEYGRLFVHQMGDGFAIVSDRHENSLERPISIATALMRYVTVTTGRFASAAISEGDFADIQGCYPDEVTCHSNNGTIILGSGIMTLSSVMGTAFIRAHKLSKAVRPSWPFLIIPTCHRNRIPPNLSIKIVSNEALSINWIVNQTPLLNEIQNKAGLKNLSQHELIQKVHDYNEAYSDIVRKWNPSLCHFLNIRNII